MRSLRFRMGTVLLLLVGLVLMAVGVVSAEPKFVEDDPSSITGTLQLWTAWTAVQGIGDMVDAFNEVYPNVTVVINTYRNVVDGNLSVDTALLAGEQIDVLLNYGTLNLERRASVGVLMPLDELLERDGIDLAKEWGTDVYRFNNTTYSLPMGGLSYYVSINLDFWNEAGLGEIPTEWTWDEYFEASRKMTTGSRYGGVDFHEAQYFMYPVQQVLGRDVMYNDEGLSNFDHPLFKRSLEQKYNAEVTEKIWFPLTRCIAEDHRGQFLLLDGTVASGISTHFTRFLRDPESFPTEYKFAFAPYPVFEAGQDNYMAGTPAYSHIGIYRGTKHPEAAWAFTKWFATHGGVYLTIAGHAPTWTGTDVANALELIFGSEEEAQKIIDIDSFNQVMFRTDAPSYAETNITAFSEVYDIASEVCLRILTGEISIDDGLKEMKTRSDNAIRRAR